MFKERYQKLYNQISPDTALIQKVQHDQKRTIKPKKLLFRRLITTVLIAVVFFTVAIPTLAANVPQVQELMQFIAPGIAQYFIPVQQSCEDQGIRMEVVSCYIHENIAEIYITMTDLLGDRIDHTIDLYDSYTIHRPFDSSASCQLVGYDNRTKTATFLIRIEEKGNHKIEGDKVSFTVRQFLSHKKTYENVEIPIDLKQVQEGIAQQLVEITGYSWSGSSEPNDAFVLVSSNEKALPFPEIVISGMGYLNGKLHIQTKISDRLRMDHHGTIFLKDTSGKQIESEETIYFIKNGYGEEREDYCEFIFNVPKEEVAGYQAIGDFTISGTKTDGNWKVTFPLKEKNQ